MFGVRLIGVRLFGDRRGQIEAGIDLAAWHSDPKTSVPILNGEPCRRFFYRLDTAAIQARLARSKHDRAHDKVRHGRAGERHRALPKVHVGRHGALCRLGPQAELAGQVRGEGTRKISVDSTTVPP